MEQQIRDLNRILSKNMFQIMWGLCNFILGCAFCTSHQICIFLGAWTKVWPNLSYSNLAEVARSSGQNHTEKKNLLLQYLLHRTVVGMGNCYIGLRISKLEQLWPCLDKANQINQCLIPLWLIYLILKKSVHEIVEFIILCNCVFF